MAIRPLFVLSAPRSGSTLLQRVLAAHDDIATTGESWLLFNLLDPLRQRSGARGRFAQVNREFLRARALERFCRELPDGRSDLRDELRETALRLYVKAAGRNSGYFLDKAPIYSTVIEEIYATFPDAKFVFLWRNPLAVISSHVELLGQGRWEVSRFPLLFDGPRYLVPAWQRHRDRSFAVRYEDLVSGSEDPWRELAAYLDIGFDPGSLDTFSQVELEGGDPVGSRLYREVSTEPLAKWRRTIHNPVRRAWCRRYFRWLGRERLDEMGYDLNELLAELDALEVGLDGIGADLRSLGRALAGDVLRAQLGLTDGRPSAWELLLRD